MSSPSASPPSSTSSTLTEEKSTCTMADVIKDYKTEELIDYLLRRENLDLEEFRSYGLKAGPAKRLADFIDEMSEQKLRSFSSYKTLDELKDVLRKYKVNGEDITSIKQFNPVFEEINDNDKALEQCMNDILLQLTNVKSMIEANETTR
ncbi:1752_t:CDS:2, partial [Paraglomus occultum]